jgi:hypothetical protein
MACPVFRRKKKKCGQLTGKDGLEVLRIAVYFVRRSTKEKDMESPLV